MPFKIESHSTSSPFQPHDCPCDFLADLFVALASRGKFSRSGNYDVVFPGDLNKVIIKINGLSFDVDLLSY